MLLNEQVSLRLRKQVRFLRLMKIISHLELRKYSLNHLSDLLQKRLRLERECIREKS